MSIPRQWEDAKDWLTYPEWQQLNARRRDAGTVPGLDFAEFRQRLTASTIKAPVQKTLLYMLDWTDCTGWTCISKARIAEATGVTTRTVQNHWNAARKAGFLRSHDYAAELRRTSDHWLLWPDLGILTGCPGLDHMARIPEAHWEGFESEFENSAGPPPF